MRFYTYTSVRLAGDWLLCWVFSMMDWETLREVFCSLMMRKRQDWDLRQLEEMALQSYRTRREEVSMLGLRSVYFEQQMQGRQPYQRSYQDLLKDSTTLKVFMMLKITSPSPLLALSGLMQKPWSYLLSILSWLYLKLTVKKMAVLPLSFPSFCTRLNNVLALFSEVKPRVKTEKEKQLSSPFILATISASSLPREAMIQMGLCFLVRKLSWKLLRMPLKMRERGKTRCPMCLGSSELSSIWLMFSIRKLEEKDYLTTIIDFFMLFFSSSYSLRKAVSLPWSSGEGCVFLARRQKISSNQVSLAVYLLMQKEEMRKNLTNFLGSLVPPVPKSRQLFPPMVLGMNVPGRHPLALLTILSTSSEIKRSVFLSLAVAVPCGANSPAFLVSLQQVFPIINYDLSKRNKSTHTEAVDLGGQDAVHALPQLLLGAVGGQLESVEAGVALGVGVLGVQFCALEGEPVDLVPVALEEGEAQDGDPA